MPDHGRHTKLRKKISQQVVSFSLDALKKKPKKLLECESPTGWGNQELLQKKKKKYKNYCKS